MENLKNNIKIISFFNIYYNYKHDQMIGHFKTINN